MQESELGIRVQKIARCVCEQLKVSNTSDYGWRVRSNEPRKRQKQTAFPKSVTNRQHINTSKTTNSFLRFLLIASNSFNVYKIGFFFFIAMRMYIKYLSLEISVVYKNHLDRRLRRSRRGIRIGIHKILKLKRRWWHESPTWSLLPRHISNISAGWLYHPEMYFVKNADSLSHWYIIWIFGPTLSMLFFVREAKTSGSSKCQN